jgi:acyl-coenzyme A thioesterase PaaI-like protein
VTVQRDVSRQTTVDGRRDLIASVRKLVARAGVTSADAETVRRVADMLMEAADLLEVDEEAGLVGVWSPRWVGGTPRLIDWGEWNPAVPPLLIDVVDDSFSARVTFPSVFAGPPGFVHGGYSATVLDHVLGLFVHHIGRTSFTAQLDVSYRRAVPVETEAVITVGVKSKEGQKTRAWGRLSVGDATMVEAEALFILIPGRPHRGDS